MIVIVLQVVWMPNNMYSEREIKLYSNIDLQWEHIVIIQVNPSADTIFYKHFELIIYTRCNILALTVDPTVTSLSAADGAGKTIVADVVGYYEY